MRWCLCDVSVATEFLVPPPRCAWTIAVFVCSLIAVPVTVLFHRIFWGCNAAKFSLPATDEKSKTKSVLVKHGNSSFYQ
jgi:hypothetical protein